MSCPSDAEAAHRYAGIEFRHLRYFAVVAEERHFGRAAARLYITQPGLSQAIARLERELEVQLFTRTHSNVELTEAGTELLNRARNLLASLDDAVAWVRMAGRGEAGVVRVGVALLAEPAVASALKAFQEEHEAIVVDRSAMVSERLLAYLAEGRLHAAVVHQIPALATAETLAWEPLRRGRLAVLAGPGSKLAHRETVTLSELSGETFLVNPRSLAPGAFEGLKLMCREFGGFDAIVLESALASTAALDADWRLIQDGTAIAVMAESTARVVCPAELALVPIQPPPQYVLALAWRRDEDGAAVHRFLGCLRTYRDQHGWTTRSWVGVRLQPPHWLTANGTRELHLRSVRLSSAPAPTLRKRPPGKADRKIVCWIGADTTSSNMSSTCGSCPRSMITDLRGHQPDPAGCNAKTAAEVTFPGARGHAEHRADDKREQQMTTTTFAADLAGTRGRAMAPAYLPVACCVACDSG